MSVRQLCGGPRQRLGRDVYRSSESSDWISDVLLSHSLSSSTELSIVLFLALGFGFGKREGAFVVVKGLWFIICVTGAQSQIVGLRSGFQCLALVANPL